MVSSNVRDWIKKADNDLKNIANNLKSEDVPTDTVCFHAQQAVEKYLKGALVHFGEKAIKTHDLVSLLTAVSKYIPDLAKLEDRLDEISRFGVESRYPDLLYEPSLEEAKKSYQQALEAKEIILKKINL